MVGQVAPSSRFFKSGLNGSAAEGPHDWTPFPRLVGWEVNPTVYDPREFRKKLAAENHFSSAVRRKGNCSRLEMDLSFVERGFLKGK